MRKAFLFISLLMILLFSFVACDLDLTSPIDSGHDETMPVVSEPVTVENTESLETDKLETSPLETELNQTETIHTHTWSEWILIAKPKCEEAGLEQRYCTDCFELQSKPLAAVGHVEVTDPAIPSSCTETGLTEGKHCSVCQGVLVAQTTVDALGHNPSAEATCTVPQTCLLCNMELAAALGHSEGEWILDRASTCIERGIRHKECSVCHEIVKTETLLLVDHIDSDWIVDRPATCTNDGMRYKECTVCKERTRRESLLALGHKEGEWILDRASTCTERGSRHKECSVCHETVKTEILLLVDHIESDWIVDRPATCTGDGLRHKECTVCGTSIRRESLWAFGHIEMIVEAVAPTCTEAGLTEGKICSCCGTVLIAQTIISAIGHDMGNWMDIIEPTCTVLGSKKRECLICNYFETHEVEALGHEYTFTVVPPSVTDEGYTEYTCSNCGDTYTETITPYTGCLEITAAFRYTFEDITFYAPSAGHYVIYSTTNETIQFGVGEMGDDGYPIYESKYYMDVDAPGYITVQARYFPWSVPEGGKMEHKYVIYKVDDSVCF